MAAEPLKIKIDYAKSSEILRSSLKMKGAPVALGFATIEDEIPTRMLRID